MSNSIDKVIVMQCNTNFQMLVVSLLEIEGVKTMPM